MREIVLYISSAATIVAWLIMIKNIITNRNMHAVLHAIHAYNTDIIYGRIAGEKISYDDMAGYCKTLFRFWDWGCKNILPKNEYELIKDYIKRG